MLERAPAWLLCCLLLFPHALYGQVARDTSLTSSDSLRVVRLDPLNAVGTRPGDLRLLHGAASLIERADIQAHKADAAHDLVRRQTGIHVMDEDPLGVNLNIGVRGLNPRRSSRVLLLEDGVPIQLGPYGDPTAHYQPPVDLLERVEIVKGAGQIMYGPQTVGGVINFVRAPPPPGTAATVSLSAGSSGIRSAYVRGGTQFGDHRVAVALNRRGAEGVRRSTTHRTDDVSVQAALAVGGGTLHVRAARYEEDSEFGEGGLTQAEFEADPRMNPTPRDVFTLERSAVTAAFTTAMGARSALVIRAYAQDTDRASWRQASSSDDRFGSEDYADDFACPPDALSETDCGFQGRPRRYRFAGIEPRLRIGTAAGALDAGVRLHHESAHRMQYVGTAPGTRGADILRDNMLRTTAWSAFTQLRAERGAFAFTPGLRIEHVRAENENRIRDHLLRDTYTQLLPGAGVSFDTRSATFFGGAHRGFAPPRPADILGTAPGEGLVQVEPELSWSYELGVRTSPRSWLQTDVTLFRTDFTNQVVEAGSAAGQRFVNAGATVHQGLEVHALAAARAGFASPTLEVAYTFVESARFASSHAGAVDGAEDVRGNRLPYAPRHLLHVTGGADLRTGTSIRVRADRVSAQFSDDRNTVAPSPDGQRGLLPAYTVLGLTMTQRAGAFTAFARVDNIADNTYITDRLEGIFTGMPRRLAAGLEYTY